jgi:hypothetical protein
MSKASGLLTDWQPIETAPHATDVLLFTPDGMEVGQVGFQPFLDAPDREPREG